MSVLIPAARQPDRLRSCLATLAADDCATTREVLVLLNGATSAVAEVAASAEVTRVLESPVNLGVAGGYNRLRAAARGELLALLHDDVEVLPGWIDRLVATLDERREAAIVGGLVLFPDGRPRSFAWIWRDGRTAPRWRTGEPAPHPASPQVEVVDYVSSSLLLVRAEAFDHVGGLDESLFPAYYVDANLALAIRSVTGQVTMLDSGARQIHHEGTSPSPYKVFLTARHRERFRERWAAELTDHEPGADCDAAWAAAAARAHTRADRLATERRWERLPPPPPFTVDAESQERRALVAEATVRAAWADELARRLAAAEISASEATAAAAAPLAERLAACESAREQEAEATREAQRALAERLAACESAREKEAEATREAQGALAELHGELEGLRRLAATRWVRAYGRLRPLLAVVARLVPRRRPHQPPRAVSKR